MTTRCSPTGGLLSEVLCLCFVQQDMEFIVGSPEERRRFFDQTLVLSDPEYMDSLRSYRQILRARNLCLRDDRVDLLDVYDAQLSARGLFLQGRRAELVKDFDSLFGALLSEIFRLGPGGADSLPAILGRADYDRRCRCPSGRPPRQGSADGGLHLRPASGPVLIRA